MSAPPATGLLFLSWVRDGLAAGLSHGNGSPGRVSIGVEIGATAQEQPLPPLYSGVTVRLHGPAEVLGFDPAQITRVEPRDGATAVEPCHFPFVELARPDFPWMFSPVAPTGRGLTPWLVLLVTSQPPAPGIPLPVLTLDPTELLPDLAEAWAWAHAQVTVPGAVPDDRDVDLALRQAPDRARSRLVAPRRLDADKSYHACLVPAFATGRDAGLGWDVKDPYSTDLAWTQGPRSGPLELPVYYSWQFHTGGAGGFEQLARRLAGGQLPPTVGLRPLDVSHPGDDLPVLTAEEALVDLEGALRAADAHPRPWPARGKVAAALTAVLAPSPHRLPPPLYGGVQAGVEATLPASGQPLWLRELNLAPEHRAAAALGTKVVQEHQEELVAQAWRQVQLAEVNTTIRHAEVAQAIQTAIVRKRVPEVAQAIQTAFVRKRVPGGAATARETLQRLARPTLRRPPDAATLTPLHSRATRPLGPIGRRVGAQGRTALRSALQAPARPSGLPLRTPTRPAGMATASTPPTASKGQRPPCGLWATATATLSPDLSTTVPSPDPSKAPRIGANGATTDLAGGTPWPWSGKNSTLPFSQPRDSTTRGIVVTSTPLQGALLPQTEDEKAKRAGLTGPGALACTLQLRPSATPTVTEAEVLCCVLPAITPNGTPVADNGGVTAFQPISLGTIWTGSPYEVTPDHWSVALAQFAEGQQQRVVIGHLLDTTVHFRVVDIGWDKTSSTRVATTVSQWPDVRLEFGVPRGQIRAMVFDFVDLDGDGDLDLVLAVLAWKPDQPTRPLLAVSKNPVNSASDAETWKRSWPTWTEVPGGWAVRPAWEGPPLTAPFSPAGSYALGATGRLIDIGGRHRPDLVIAYPTVSYTKGVPALTATAYWDLDESGIPQDTSTWLTVSLKGDVPAYPKGAACSLSIADFDPGRGKERTDMVTTFQQASAAVLRPHLAPASPLPERARRVPAARSSGSLLAALDPAAITRRRLREIRVTMTTRPVSGGPSVSTPARVENSAWGLTGGTTRPLLAPPRFDQPAYQLLRDLSAALMLPGVADIPDEHVGLLFTNPVFIEAFMVGLNHEMGRELSWRGFPTDRRATTFRRFWGDPPGGVSQPLDPIAEWGDRPLGGVTDGNPPTPGSGTGQLALVVRGELLRRFSHAHVYAHPATPAQSPPGALVLDPAASPIEPSFKAELPPDIVVFGFELTKDQAEGDGNPPYPHGVFLVFEQPPSNVTFGLDEADDQDYTASPPQLHQWSDLRWSQLTPLQAGPQALSGLGYVNLQASAGTLRQRAHSSDSLILPVAGGSNTHTVGWGADAAAMAHICYRAPIRLAHHAQDLLKGTDDPQYTATRATLQRGAVIELGGDHPDGRPWRLTAEQAAWLASRGTPVQATTERATAPATVLAAGGRRLPRPGEHGHETLLRLPALGEDHS